MEYMFISLCFIIKNNQINFYIFILLRILNHNRYLYYYLYNDYYMYHNTYNLMIFITILYKIHFPNKDYLFQYTFSTIHIIIYY